MNFGATTVKIVYDNASYDISGNVYIELEDKIKAIDKLVGTSEGEKELAKEWLTYNTLINDGHFVSKPSSPEPTLSKTFSEPESTLADIPFYESEKEWSRERILAEREKLLRKEEALFKKQKAVFEARPKQLSQTRQFYHPDGSPYTNADYHASYLTLTVVVLLLLSVIIFCSVSG